MIESDNMVLKKISIKEFVINDIEEIALPASILLDPANDDVEAPHDPRFQISQKMHAFAIRAGEVGTLYAFPVAEKSRLS